MTHPYQIGDVVHVRKHTDEEKQTYPSSWTAHKNHFEDVNAVITRIASYGDGVIHYQLHLMKSQEPIRPGQTREDVVAPDDYELFAADSIELVAPSPFRHVVVNDVPMPYIGDIVPGHYFGVDNILWGITMVMIDRRPYCSTKIPEPAFTTF